MVPPPSIVIKGVRNEGKVFDQLKIEVDGPSPACDGVRAVRRNERVEHPEASYQAGHFHVKRAMRQLRVVRGFHNDVGVKRSEEHTSELQSHLNLVCRLLLEKKK